jgi:hypothetical protein
MRVPASEHTTRPWRIHEVTPDFRIEDVWAYRTPGAGPDDFPDMLTALRAAGGLNENPPVVRFLFGVRWKLGAMFGWDKPEQGVVGRVESTSCMTNAPSSWPTEPSTTSVTWDGCRPTTASTSCGWQHW